MIRVSLCGARLRILRPLRLPRTTAARSSSRVRRADHLRLTGRRLSREAFRRTAARGSVIGSPPLLRHRSPEYDAALRARKAAGIIKLELEIGKDGRVEAAKRLGVDDDEDLARAAIQAVKEWRFARTCFEGAPIASILVVAVRFPTD